MNQSVWAEKLQKSNIKFRNRTIILIVWMVLVTTGLIILHVFVGNHPELKFVVEEEIKDKLRFLLVLWCPIFALLINLRSIIDS